MALSQTEQGMLSQYRYTGGAALGEMMKQLQERTEAAKAAAMAPVAVPKWEDVYKSYETSLMPVMTPIAQRLATELNTARKAEVGTTVKDLEQATDRLSQIRRDWMAGRLATADEEMAKTRSAAASYGSGFFGGQAGGPSEISKMREAKQLGLMQEQLVGQGTQLFERELGIAQQLNPFTQQMFMASPKDLYAQRGQEAVAAKNAAMQRYADMAGDYGQAMGYLRSGTQYRGADGSVTRGGARSDATDYARVQGRTAGGTTVMGGMGAIDRPTTPLGGFYENPNQRYLDASYARQTASNAPSYSTMLNPFTGQQVRI